MTDAISGKNVSELTLGDVRVPEEDGFMPFTRHPIYFALTRPIGTHTSSVTSALVESLNDADYYVHRIRLSNIIAKVYLEITGNELPATVENDRRRFTSYRGLMRAGDTLRLLDPALVGKVAVLEINRRRKDAEFEALEKGKRGIAYLITHLMHPAEVQTLRSVYGQRFFLIAANAERSSRQSYLAEGYARETQKEASGSQLKTDIGASQPEFSPEEKDSIQLARELIAIDAGIKSSMQHLSPKRRLNVDDTFHLADLFVRSRAESFKASPSHLRVDSDVKHEVRRFVNQVFSNPFGTPTVNETAMATAFLAARSSVSLGRSVGAVVVNDSGSVISTGWNEVARPSGGPYRENDEPDHRDHMNGFDPSDVSRVDAIQSFVSTLLSPGSWAETIPTIEQDYPESASWLSELAKYLPPEGLSPSTRAVAGLAGLESFDNTRIMHLIEFGRSVHAEMAALSDAFRRGVGGTELSIYVTTFPCHECTRNLISFGLKEVVYVEPYGKSMAELLYGDEIQVFPSEEKRKNDTKVVFTPYGGVAPKRLQDLFSVLPRKRGFSDRAGARNIGAAVDWSLERATLRPAFVDYPPGFNPAEVVPVLEVARLASEVVVAESAVAKITSAANNYPHSNE
ncbi:hypothetical protein [Microbacterium schleiferi]|uniref:CMP/dCMP-type deaminase domain-containing protein n=1 Tax=Microbacterium schleiferi TaxID=69362 RepID=A0ABU7VBP5_9MICO